jgi:hypothetical protein
MKPKITTAQLLSLNKLLTNLKKFSEGGFGNINEVEVLSYKPMEKNLYLKFEKIYSESGNIKVEHQIAEINNVGDINFIEKNFKDIFQRSAFFSECTKIDINNPNDYEKID